MLMLLLLVSVSAEAASPLCHGGKVVELDGSTFDAAISDCRNILVDFYAPWCSHCNALAPQLDEAATKLGDGLTLAKINVDKFTGIASRYKINAYPTLKLFVDAVETDYQGPLKADLMVAQLKRMLAPPLSSLSSPSAAKQFVAQAGDTLPVFIGFGVEAATMAQLAHEHKLNAWFATVDQHSAASELDVLSSGYGIKTLPALLVEHLSVNEQAVFQGPFEEGDALASFVRRNLLPLVTNLTYDNVDLVKADGRPILLAIATDDGVHDRMKRLAPLHLDMLFAALNSSSSLAEIFYSSKLLVWDGKTNFYMRLGAKGTETEVEVTAEEISALATDYKNNNVKRNATKQPSFLEQLVGFMGQNALYMVLFFVTVVVFLQTMDWTRADR